MQIKTQADVDALDLQIQNDLGIDLKTYVNEDVADRFADLVVLPMYVLGVLWRPVIGCFILYILGFFAVDLVHVQYLIYGIIGFVLFLLSGILIGILSLVMKLKADLHDILMYSYEILKASLNDLNKMSDSISPENKPDVVNLMFKGVIHIVTIPLVARAISRKIPLVGGLLKRIINRTLSIIASLFKIDTKQIEHKPTEEDTDAAFLESYSTMVNRASQSTGTLISSAFRVAIIPLVLVSSLVIMALFWFVYIMW